MLRYGYALWHPEPHKTGEAQIGDVGYIREGAFIRLFNLNASKPEHQVRQFRRKPSFEPTAPLSSEVFEALDERRSLLPIGSYRSHGVQQSALNGAVNIQAERLLIPTILLMLCRPVAPSTSIDAAAGYTCKESQGAVLVLNRPAHLEAILKSVTLREYIRRHHGEWYNYARNVLDQDISREDVTLVSGCIKTSPDWKVVAFMRSTIGYHASLGAHALGGAGVELSAARSLESSPPTMHREGSLYSSRAPSDSTDLDEADGDQCMFLQRYKIKWRGLQIVAGAGYHELPKDKDRGNGADGERVAAPEDDDDEDGIPGFRGEVNFPMALA